MSRAAFMAGVQHASRMLAEAERLQVESTKCPYAIEAQHLEGREQSNFAMQFLARLLLEPEILEGFAAAMSDYLGMGDQTKASYYARLTEADVFEAA